MNIERREQVRASRRRRRRGMTLVEIMIVVIIMALIATAVGVAVLPQLRRAREDATRSDAQQVQSAAVLYLGQQPGADCPSVADLVEAGVIDRTRRTTDAWDHEFVIECDGTASSSARPAPTVRWAARTTSARSERGPSRP